MSGKPYTDPEWLRKKYYEEGYTTNEMADMAGCTSPTILRHMDKNGMDRKPQFVRAPPPRVEIDESGYERFRSTCKGERKMFKHHQLLAIAEGLAEPDEVFGEELIDVHHVNEVPWDNRPDNLEVLTRGEHMAKHASKMNWTQKTAALHMESDGVDIQTIADSYGVNREVIYQARMEAEA